MKDVTEQAEIPRLGDGSDANDEPVEMKENLQPAPLALEHDELERKRSYLDVPLRIKRT